MVVYTGTSGYSYKWWFSNKSKTNPEGKQMFYPKSVKQKDALTYYSTQLKFCELNATFYKLPKVEDVKNWYSSVPSDFRFLAKFSKYGSHSKKLVDFENLWKEFWTERLTHLKEKCLGVLIQLPPTFQYSTRKSKADDLTVLERMQKVSDIVGTDTQIYIEFRHSSWFCEEVYKALRNMKWVLVHVNLNNDLQGYGKDMKSGFTPLLSNIVETVPNKFMFRCHGTWPQPYTGGYTKQQLLSMYDILKKKQVGIVAFDNTDSFEGQIYHPLSRIMGCSLADEQVMKERKCVTPHAIYNALLMKDM